MMRVIFTFTLLVFLIAPAKGETPKIEISDPLPATTMLRTLHAVQDRIATGDAASLPLQKHLLELIAPSIAGLAKVKTPDALLEERNTAFILYALSGGAADTARGALAVIDHDEPLRALAHAVADNIGGRRVRALRRFLKIEMTSLPVSLVPYVALAKGQLLAQSEPDAGIVLLSIVGQLAPGTLLEEAALRRKLQLALRGKMAARFYAAARQYTYRFIGSPYRASFAQALQKAAVEFPEHGDDLDAVLALMPENLRSPMQVRIARMALLAGQDGLARKMVQRVDIEGQVGEVARRTQSLFVEAVSRLAGKDVKEQRKILVSLDRRFLNAEDKKLVDVAVAIADTIVSPVSRAAGTQKQSTTDRLPVVGLANETLAAVDALLSESDGAKP
ncbi:chemotaxis protein [Ahrensia sp. R2A130]|uniref:chemotaxis protein n=1 Tax=Ahrensia sp. R2A130 TaxID=744979 RepID=UPI0001E0F86F|nr:chemotaxis protein [Ahrensia sp. R2A130]EFL89486.1 putative chemotaxis protein [Ahrensia sp. R2A130]